MLDAQRKNVNMKAIKRDNHKSAMEKAKVVREAVEKDTALGFQFVFDLSLINEIPN